MSASREKKKRTVQPETSVTAEAPKKNTGKALKRVLTVVIAVVLVAAIVFLGMVSTGFFQQHLTAAVVDGHKLSPAVLNYYYTNAYRTVQNYMGSAMDTSKPLSEQEYTGDGYDTWADYVLDYAGSLAANTYAIYDEAVSKGFTMPEDSQSSIDNELAMISAYATMYGYSNANAFLTAQYGAGCNASNYKDYLTVTTLASAYSTSIANSLTYTQEQIDARYNENPEAYDGVTYHFFSVTPSLFPDETDTDAAMKLCEEAAKDIAEKGKNDEQGFTDAVLSYDESATSTLREDYTVGSCAESYREWIADDARQEGDTTYVANGDTGYIAIYFVRHEDHTYQMPVVRHILISVSDTSDTTAMENAKSKATSILTEYEAGEHTEEAFAALAKEYSDDNADEGGLIEGIAPGVMVQNFEDWAYADHQIGDTGVIETEYGYHVMYFQGYGQTYQDYMVETAMKNDDYNAWSTSVTENASYTINDSVKRFLVKL